MNAPRRVDALLTLADEDVAAAVALAGIGNRYAAYHCQQAVEKLIKAVLLHADVESGTEHRLDVLLEKIPDDGWRTALTSFKRYTQ